MDKILREITKIPKVEIDEFMELFQESNTELLEKCKIVTVKPEIRFVVSGEEISRVWILLRWKKTYENFSHGKIHSRIKIYLVQQYRLYAKSNTTCVLKIPRQQIGEETGYSVKTIKWGRI